MIVNTHTSCSKIK